MRSTTNVILLLAFRTVVVVMSCAILSSRVALHRKTSAISMPTSRRLRQQDYLILNSVTNIHKTIERLSRYDSVQCFLDNDGAGRNAYLRLSKKLGNSVTDASNLYNGFKDLNEYLCAEFKHSEKAENKKTKGIKL